MAKKNTHSVKEEMGGEMGEYAAGCAVMEMAQTVRQELQSVHGFFLDLDIPPEFREAIMFHELREKSMQETKMRTKRLFMTKFYISRSTFR